MILPIRRDSRIAAEITKICPEVTTRDAVWAAAECAPATDIPQSAAARAGPSFSGARGVPDNVVSAMSAGGPSASLLVSCQMTLQPPDCKQHQCCRGQGQVWPAPQMPASHQDETGDPQNGAEAALPGGEDGSWLRRATSKWFYGQAI